MKQRIDINRLLAARPRNCQYGAPLGRRNYFDGAGACYLQRVAFVDGCYSRDGTYWGAPADLWAAFTADLGTLAFVRASSRQDAARKFRELEPTIAFHKASRDA